MGLGIEEDLCVADVLRRRLFEIGEGQFVEVLLVQQDGRTLIVDVEKRLQVVERVGVSHFFHSGERKRDVVAFGNLEHELGLERAFDVDVKLCFRKAADEGFDGCRVVHSLGSGG